MTDAIAHTVRPAKQERSKVAWNRALEAGLALLESGGLDAVTITEVCRRGRISPPSLYARIDGRAGLIAAIYEHGMRQVRILEQSLLDAIEPQTLTVEQRVSRVVAAMTEVFARQRSLLGPIIASSVHDERIHTRGVEEAMRVQDVMVGILDLAEDAARDIAAMIFAELVMRTVYGGEFTAVTPETDDEFVARLTRTGVARARA